MLLGALLTGISAVLVAGAPTADGFGVGEVQLFARDAVLSARDLELAELHGVNLTEMYKHSVVKSDDGDHITIWVDNSYTPLEGPEEDSRQVEKRQGGRAAGNSRYYTTQDRFSNCWSHNMASDTSSRSPFSGGALGLARWGENNRGHWVFVGAGNSADRRTLAIGGSNSGHNAQYRAEMHYVRSLVSAVGTHDMGYCARKTYDNFKRDYSGVWRAGGRGSMTCNGDYEDAKRSLQNVGFDWDLISSTARV